VVIRHAQRANGYRRLPEKTLTRQRFARTDVRRVPRRAQHRNLGAHHDYLAAGPAMWCSRAEYGAPAR
jgi:hypothetical protein